MATQVTSQHLMKGYTYEDSDFTRKKEGVELPCTTAPQIQALNKGFPWETWGGLRLSKCRCFFVRPNGTMVLFTTVRKILGNTETPCRLVLPYLSIPNGQVKNFLNACRAVGIPKDQYKIAIVGSKSQEGGGAWHTYFLKYLQMFSGSYIVDFFDYAEVADQRVLTTENTFISAEWIVSPFTQELVKDYDLIIDDAWTIASGPGLKLHGDCRYSWKGEQTESVPFLHETEHRKFSEGPRVTVQTGCRCPVCRVIKESVDDYEQYIYIRSLCYRLGYTVPCEGTEHMGDLKGLSKIYYDLLSSPSITLQRQGQLRYLISLSEEIGIVYSGGEARKRGEAKFKDFGRYKKKTDLSIESVVPYFDGHSVVFAGVSPSILGATRITKNEPEFLFVNSIETWKTQVSPKIVYCQSSTHDVERSCPQYRYSGRVYLDYREFVRHEEVEVILPKQRGIQKTGLATHVAAKIIHQLEIDKPLQAVGPPKKDYRIYSLEIDKMTKTTRKIEFKSALWRTSIYVNPDQTWGPLKQSLKKLERNMDF